MTETDEAGLKDLPASDAAALETKKPSPTNDGVTLMRLLWLALVGWFFFNG
jgi:hypothetical protein